MTKPRSRKAGAFLRLSRRENRVGTRANIDRVEETNRDRAALTALSPLDGRYAGKVSALREQFSEFALIRHRVRIELAWLCALAAEPAIEEVPPLSDAAKQLVLDSVSGDAVNRDKLQELANSPSA